MVAGIEQLGLIFARLFEACKRNSAAVGLSPFLLWREDGGVRRCATGKGAPVRKELLKVGVVRCKIVFQVGGAANTKLWEKERERKRESTATAKKGWSSR